MSKNIRKRWFRGFKGFLKLFIRKSEFLYLGEKLEGPCIILTNHEAAAGPLAYELYFNEPFRFWGTYEMNNGLISTYRYLTKTYYHEKKHWNIHLARIFCLIAAPLCNLFYKGLNLISTYPDSRFRKTLRESLKTLENGNNVIIFPEASEKGYFKHLTKFHEGFIVFLEYCKKHHINIPVYVAYYKSKEKKCILDKPIYINELLELKLSRESLALELRNRCNEIGRKTFNELKSE